jgi:hypothetical protein
VRQCSPVMLVPSDVSRRSTRRATAVRMSAVLVAAGALASLTGCGDEAPSAERFCGEIAANRDALTNPQLVYTDDIEPLLDLYRDIAALAPLAVEDDWNQILTAYETASTVVVGDEESEQEALTAIYSSERSAATVEAWLMANCAVDIGPVFTIVPQGPLPAPPAATVAPGDSVPIPPDAGTPSSTP